MRKSGKNRKNKTTRVLPFYQQLLDSAIEWWWNERLFDFIWIGCYALAATGSKNYAISIKVVLMFWPKNPLNLNHLPILALFFYNWMKSLFPSSHPFKKSKFFSARTHKYKRLIYLFCIKNSKIRMADKAIEHWFSLVFFFDFWQHAE